MKAHPLRDTISLVRVIHAGQSDRSGNDLWRHPVRTLMRLGTGAPLVVQQAALLHDALEGSFDLDDLAFAGIPDDVLEIVSVLTPPAEMHTRQEWIQEISASGHTNAIWVKLASSLDHSAPDRVMIPDGQKVKLQYLNAAMTLTPALPRELASQMVAGPIFNEEVDDFIRQVNGV